VKNKAKRQQLIIFVKNRREGHVKTRLAASIGKANALEVYNHLLKITADTARKVETDRLVSYSGHTEKVDQFERALFKKSVQSEGDLGERMDSAFKESFADGYEKVVLIGSDCPDISPSIIQRAFQLLDEADCVLGPSADGGYYLIGLKRPVTEIFLNMKWSVDSVFVETVKRLNAGSVSYRLLPILNDIDTAEDLKKSRLSI